MSASKREAIEINIFIYSEKKTLGKIIFLGFKSLEDSTSLFVFWPSVIWHSGLTPTSQNQWRRISCKHNTRWQHLSQLKASVFFSMQKIFVNKWSNLYLGLVTPSSGWSSPILKAFLDPTDTLCKPQYNTFWDNCNVWAW